MIKVLKSDKYAKMVTDIGIEKDLAVLPGFFKLVFQSFQLEKQNLKHQNPKHKIFIRF